MPDTPDRASYDLDDPTLLFGADFLDDPAPLYAQLRREAPVWELPGTGTFLVTTAALVGEAVARPEDFSSNLLSLLYTGDEGRPAVFDMSATSSAPPAAHRESRWADPIYSCSKFQTVPCVIATIR